MTRYTALAGAHAEGLHDELVAFSPSTREVQADEKWGFVAKKEATCDPLDPLDGSAATTGTTPLSIPRAGCSWPLVHGKRDGATCERLIRQVHERTGGRTDLLITTDEHAPYESAIRAVYGDGAAPAERPGRAGRPSPRGSSRRSCATRRCGSGGRGAGWWRWCGRWSSARWCLLGALLRRSTASTTINTSFVERNNGTDRHQNSRKRRKGYGFSKELAMHGRHPTSSVYSYNFCWPVRTLRVRQPDGTWSARTPAMAAGLSDHVWSLEEWVTYPAKPC